MHRCALRVRMIWRMIWLLSAVTPLLSAAADPSTIAKYVYPDGRVVYSDKPVPGARLEKEIKIDTPAAGQSPPAGAAKKASKGSAAAASPAAPSRVVEELGPIIAEARDGDCHMWVQGEGQVFAVHVEGLVPGESVDVTSTSDGETIHGTQSAHEDGTYGTAIFPAVAGESSGRATFRLRGSRCQLSVTFSWHL